VRPPSRRCAWFAARADQLSVVREAMRSWLASAGVGEGDTEILVLAAGELCANAVEHAYAGAPDGSVEVGLGREAGGALTLVVRDRGRWRPPPADAGNRGRGLGIVRALMHVVDVDEGAEGTTVSVRYRPGEVQPPPSTAVGGPATVAIGTRDGLPVATVQGEIDGTNAQEVADQLLAPGPGPMVVDLSGVAFLASAGLRVLFTVAQHTGRLAVVAPAAAPFRRALEVAELGRVALIADTLDAALEDLRRP
jgi:anti-anti-sigma factor